MTRIALATIALLLVAAPAHAGTGPGPDPLVCPPPDQALSTAPEDAPPSGDLLPVRSDADGFTTLTLTVEDPPAPPDYVYGPVSNGVGVYTHRWQTERPIYTIGLFSQQHRTRLPLALLEADLDLGRIIDGEIGPATNTTSLVQALLGITPGAFPSRLDLYADMQPVYVWTTYRTTPDGRQVWQGFVRRHTGTARTAADGGLAEGCRRTRIDAVTRIDDTVQELGGVWLLDQVRGTRGTTVEMRQHLIAGARAGGIDVPLTVIDQKAVGEGETYRDAPHQQNDLALGAYDERGEFYPLIGLRSVYTRPPHPDGFGETISAGVYGRTHEYHPQVGLRTHREVDNFTGLLVQHGLGAPGIGDQEWDLGAFDPWGTFVPLVGAAYDDGLATVGRADAPTGIVATQPAQALVSAGTWVDDAYVPMVGATYEGVRPSSAWTNVVNNQYAGDWLTSAGAFAPNGYVPAAGLRYTQGAPSGAFDHVEHYRMGTFTGSYSGFVPVAGIDWRSSMPSRHWLYLSAWNGASSRRVAAAAEIDAGPVGPGGTFVPIAGARFTKGEQTDRHHLGLWLLGSFTSVLDACYTSSGTSARAGIGVAGQQLGWAGTGGTAPAGLGPCP